MRLTRASPRIQRIIEQRVDNLWRGDVRRNEQLIFDSAENLTVHLRLTRASKRTQRIIEQRVDNSWRLDVRRNEPLILAVVFKSCICWLNYTI